MLHVSYVGLGGRAQRYHCRGANINHGEHMCISFGGLRPDQAVATALLDVVQPKAIEAALDAAQRIARERSDEQRAIAMELEQARYDAHLSARRYEGVDPDNRLVAAELEARWNASLTRVHELEGRLQEVTTESAHVAGVNREEMIALANDLPAVWNSDVADMRLKQRIVRLLIREIVADVDDAASEIALVIHWIGGRHTELRIPKNKTG